MGKKKIGLWLLIFVVLLSMGCSSFAENDSDGVLADTIEHYEMIIDKRELKDSDLSRAYMILGHSDEGDYRAYYDYLQAIRFLETEEFEKVYEKLDHALAYLADEPNDQVEMLILDLYILVDSYFENVNSMLVKSFRLWELAKSHKNSEMLISANFYVAESYYYMYEDEKAMAYLNDAFKLAQKAGDDMGMAYYYVFKGDVESDEGNYEIALGYYQNALIFYSESDRHFLISDPKDDIVGRMAFCNVKMGRYDAAMGLIKGIAGTLNESDYSKWYKIFYFQGLIYFEQGDYPSAIEAFEKSLECHSMSVGIRESSLYEISIYTYLGKAYYEEEDYRRAAGLLNEVIEYYDGEEVIEDIGTVNRAFREFEEAKLVHQLSLVTELKAAQDEIIKVQRRYLVFFMGLIVLLMILIALIIREIKSRVVAQRALYQKSITDNLTCVANREHIIELFRDRLADENAVALMDVDDFKWINDTYGHVVGDQVLKRVAEAIRDSIRSQDALGRYGGEEFLILFERTTLEDAKRIAERIRANVEAIEWDHSGLKTTVSIGVSQCHLPDADAMLHEVDALMYQAKRDGKNRVVIPEQA